MEDCHFDRVARSLAGAGETRRGVLRLLAGGALGMLAARLGLAEEVAAKNEKPRRRRQAAAKRHGAVQAEGKRKKKRQKPKPKPQLCDAYCEEDGGRCCPGGRCVFEEQCCPGEKACGDGSCVGLRQCCPVETPCRDGSCSAPGRCCPEQRQCADGSCVAEGICCPDEKRSVDGGACYAAGFCCPNDPAPICPGQCGEVICEGGEWVCRPRREGETCGGPGTACCQGRCYTTACGAGRTGQARHFNPDNCRCECDEVLECPPGQAFAHGSCECECNCAGRCCVSGCCARPDRSAYCCQGY